MPALAGFAYLCQHNLFFGLVLFAMSSAIGAIDGAVARVTQSISNLGAFLNGIIDRYVEILFYLGLFLYLDTGVMFLLPNSLWILLLVFGSIMPSFIKAYADHKKVITDSDDLDRMEGMFGRNGRMVLIYIGMLLGLCNIIYLVYVIAFSALFTNIASLQRVFFVVKKSA
jgi:phosphatidylglycerophosphate synthase